MSNPNFDQLLSTTLANYRNQLTDNVFTARPHLTLSAQRVNTLSDNLQRKTKNPGECPGFGFVRLLPVLPFVSSSNPAFLRRDTASNFLPRCH